jgi:hypothetical protein
VLVVWTAELVDLTVELVVWTVELAVPLYLNVIEYIRMSMFGLNTNAIEFSFLKSRL